MSHDNRSDSPAENDELSTDELVDGDTGSSRRTFLQAAAATGALGGLGSLGLAQQENGTDEQGDGFFAQGIEVGTQMVADGMTAPTDMAVANPDDDRFFVTDQTGQVWIVTQDGRQPEAFIDIQERMVDLGTFYGLYASQGQEYDERGLIGIEFHPNFSENRKFYLHYSAPPTEELKSINWDHIEVISEFTANEDLSSANPESERKLLEIPSPQYNHDSGPMAFGPDDYLYIPMGDGGGANDDMYGHAPDWYDENKGGNGQDLITNLMGDVLRIDVDSQEGDKPYGIPDDNPFVGTDARDEIYAYGFRNPYGISFDSDGTLFIPDSGQNLWEEVSLVERGGNYGWNVKEGTHCFSTANPSDPTALTECPSMAPDEPPYNGDPLQDPIVEYPHFYEGTPVGVVVVGGHRYENDTISGLQNKYVFGEYNQPTGDQPNGRILTATPPGDGAGTETATEMANETATEMANETATEMANETATETANETATEMANETTAANETATETATGTGTQDDIPPEGPEVVPRDELWEMAELQVQGDFNWYVRLITQDSDGELYVLVTKEGAPVGDTGAVLRLVPPGEGDTPAEATETETATPGNETATANETSTNETG